MSRQTVQTSLNTLKWKPIFLLFIEDILGNYLNLWRSPHLVTDSYACRNTVNTIKTSGHSSLVKYTSHFIRRGYERVTKGLWVRGELETEQRLQHIDPHSSGYSSISFPISWAAQPGAWGPSLCLVLVITPRTGTLTSNSNLRLI